jgi:hypothetical protein
MVLKIIETNNYLILFLFPKFGTSVFLVLKYLIKPNKIAPPPPTFLFYKASHKPNNFGT